MIKIKIINFICIRFWLTMLTNHQEQLIFVRSRYNYDTIFQTFYHMYKQHQNPWDQNRCRGFGADSGGQIFIVAIVSCKTIIIFGKNHLFGWKIIFNWTLQRQTIRNLFESSCFQIYVWANTCWKPSR